MCCAECAAIQVPTVRLAVTAVRRLAVTHAKYVVKWERVCCDLSQDVRVFTYSYSAANMALCHCDLHRCVGADASSFLVSAGCLRTLAIPRAPAHLNAALIA
jgi:hypothetical protein